jgi:PPIC-type PPIASE domain
MLAGCGKSSPATVTTPIRVPAGAVAIVGATPIKLISLKQWLPIVEGGEAAPGLAAGKHQRAVADTVAFLVKAQWLLQESRAEGIDESVVDRRVSKRSAEEPPQNGMSSADAAYQTRLNFIAEVLESRHGHVAVTQAQIEGYYNAHRSQFVEPAVRYTLMVVTRSRSDALTARAALASGERWSAVARRWSVDSSSALNGGAYAVAEGAQSPVLVHAVFAARRGAIVGPVKVPATAEPMTHDYYLFKVTGAIPASHEPLARVAERIRRTLAAQERERSLAAFTRAYEARWRTRTLCAPGYVVAECRNYAVTAPGYGP